MVNQIEAGLPLRNSQTQLIFDNGSVVDPVPALSQVLNGSDTELLAADYVTGLLVFSQVFQRIRQVALLNVGSQVQVRITGSHVLEDSGITVANVPALAGAHDGIGGFARGDPNNVQINVQLILNQLNSSFGDHVTISSGSVGHEQLKCNRLIMSQLVSRNDGVFGFSGGGVSGVGIIGLGVICDILGTAGCQAENHNQGQQQS